MKQRPLPFGWIHLIFFWHLPVFVWRETPYYAARVCTACEKKKEARYPTG